MVLKAVVFFIFCFSLNMCLHFLEECLRACVHAGNSLAVFIFVRVIECVWKLVFISIIEIHLSGTCRQRTTRGYCCFPFAYRGRRYNGCARTRRGRRWCAITPNYRKNKMWGYCRGGRKRKIVFSFPPFSELF